MTSHRHLNHAYRYSVNTKRQQLKAKVVLSRQSSSQFLLKQA